MRAVSAYSGSRKCRRRDTDKYGIVEVEPGDGIVSRIRSIVEKPKPAVAPSTLAVVGRYVLTPTIFDELERVGQGAGGEIQLTDGIARLLQREPVYAHRFTGRRFDCGSKLGYLQATVELSLAHPVLGDGVSQLPEAPGRHARRVGLRQHLPAGKRAAGEARAVQRREQPGAMNRVTFPVPWCQKKRRCINDIAAAATLQESPATADNPIGTASGYR